MSSPLLVKISRDGKEVGTYEAQEAVRLLISGILKRTDFYWHEGMRVWELLSKLDTTEGLRLPAEPEVKRQTARKLFGCGGCGLSIFLICSFYSVYLYNYSLGSDKSDKAFSEAGAYCCCAISLLGLCIFIFKKK